MASLIHADIFFFVTTVCVVLLTVLCSILFIYLFRFLATLRAIADKAKSEGDFILDEVHELVQRIERRRFGFRALFRFFRRIVQRYY
ncbi:hypothetical protein KGP36_01390 [Patescibacteria group bacterium]|nr:hypothetical protein [Patescibacteria group bacterium]